MAGYPQLSGPALIAQERSDVALKAALAAGYSDADAWTVADRARSETRAGFRNDTARFAGTLAGCQPVRLYTYTGRVIDPLASGMASASTLD